MVHTSTTLTRTSRLWYARCTFLAHSLQCDVIVPFNWNPQVAINSSGIETEASLTGFWYVYPHYYTSHTTRSVQYHIKINSFAILTALSRPNSFSTMARANSVAVPGALLVIRLPSTTTLCSHALWSVSRCNIGGNAVAFLPYNDTGSSKLIHLAAFCSYTNAVSLKL